MIVWLASYPRSGNTFFRVILNSVFDIKTYSVYDDKEDIGADEKTSEVVGHKFLPKDFNIEEARKEKNINYIKTHELLDNRVDPKDKVIYLIRDGRESTLSFTKHQNTFANQDKKLLDTIYGNTFVGAWGEHVTSWNPKNRKNTLCIKFEEITKDPVKFINILSEFLNLKPIGDTVPSFEELKEINPKFFRSGKINSWEDIYTQEEHFSFWLKNYQVMDEYGYVYSRPKELDLLINKNSIELELLRQNDYLIKLSLSNEENFKKLLQSKEQQLLTKTKTLENKIIEIVKKDEMLKNKTRELQLKEQQLSQIKQDQKNLFTTIDAIFKVSVLKNPFKKMEAYRKIKKIYYQIRG